nr:MAG: hypothetical protein CM1200mP41_38010 [Gammaproteobacteria bacterium]
MFEIGRGAVRIESKGPDIERDEDDRYATFLSLTTWQNLLRMPGVFELNTITAPLENHVTNNPGWHRFGGSRARSILR